MGRSLLFVLLVGAGAAAVYWWPQPFGLVRAASEVPMASLTPPSEDLAQQAEEKLETILAGTPAEVTLSGPELESLLLYRFDDRWPRGVSSPSVRLSDGELLLGLHVTRDVLPALPDMEAVLAFLPDTVPVQLRGRVVALGSGDAALLVHRIDASSIPIPRRLFPLILSQVQGQQAVGVPPEALVLPLPQEVRALRIEGSSLILSPIS